MTNTVWLHLHEVARAVKFIETESRIVVARSWWEGSLDSCLTGIACQF